MTALRRDETRPIHTRNLAIPIAYPFAPPRAGREPFAMSCISERHAWLAGVCVSFPDSSDCARSPQALRMKSALAGRLRDRGCSWIRVDGDGLRLALGDSCRWRTRPGWCCSVCIGALCVWLVARTAPRTPRARDGGASAIGGLTSRRIGLWPVMA